MAFLFSIVGDSNITRHMSPLNCRDRPLMSGAQLIPCGRMVTLAESLKSVRIESNVVLLSCLTNFITRAVDISSTVGVQVEPILSQFLGLVQVVCLERSETAFLVCPPMYRTTPMWYRDAMPEILQKFSEVMKSRPQNLLLMPSFPRPSLESDGVHLTAYSGLEFVVHMFDNAIEIVSSINAAPEVRCLKTNEATRALEDRMVAIEQDHRRLNKEFESKSVVDHELACFNENIRFENHFVIQGLSKIPEMSPKEWQVRALQDVKIALGLFLDREMPILYVQNVTGMGKKAKVTYQVRMQSAADSKEARDKFSGFFVGKKDTRPPALKPVSIRNRISKATPVRISLLRLIGERYVASNKGYEFKVLGYEPRPLLKIFPAKDASDRRVKTYNYIEAIKYFPTNFSDSELEPILERISPKLKGKLRQIFGVIDDDMLRRLIRDRRQENGAQADQAGEDDDGELSDGASGSSSSNPKKRGASTALSGKPKASKSGKGSRK